jgi:hypothetical protein
MRIIALVNLLFIWHVCGVYALYVGVIFLLSHEFLGRHMNAGPIQYTKRLSVMIISV